MRGGLSVLCNCKLCLAILWFNPCGMLLGLQACSRSSPAHDSYFGGAVGGKDYSTGVLQ